MEEEIVLQGGTAKALQADVSDQAAVRSLLNIIKENFGN